MLRYLLRTMVGVCWLFSCQALAQQAETPTTTKTTVRAPMALPTGVRLILPPELPAVVGLETNVYFDNISLLLNPANFTFDVTCAKGRQLDECWTLTPQPVDVGRHPWKVEVRDAENRIVAQAETVLNIVAADARADRPLTALIVGDSLTHASIYPQRLVELCEKPGNPRLTLIGSYGPGGMPGVVRHEGYGGWTALRFATHFAEQARTGDYKQRGSPFLYRDALGKPQLDFARYYADVAGGTAPDYVSFFLGPNDTFSANDETIESTVDTMLTHLDALIAAIHRASATTRVVVLLPVPPAASQDAFGANYASGQTRWQYKRNQHRLVERMIGHYAGREAERIELAPTHVNLDTRHNYPAAVQPANLHADAKITRLNNGVHPSAAGYRQIGDSFYAWLKSRP